jgi:transcriptional regulator of acetoin/glycerol metabolism
MTPAHAQALQARGNTLPPEGLPGAVVLDSWGRCLRAGLDPHAALDVPVVDGADLRRRRERSEFVRQLAQAELETLSRQIAGSNFLLAFADREGVILDLYADNRFSMSGNGAGIVAGSCWTEGLAGTNGLGTALATGAPVAVTGLEHFFVSLGNVSCTAAPVRDARGDIVGVLDASSYFDSRQRHTQALVQMAATHIENGLLLHQMRQHWVLAIHPRPEFLGTLSAGLLAFDEGGRLLALNVRAAQLLQGLDAAPGAAFETLFGERFDLVTARLQHQGEQRLRDALGSTLVAMCLARPPQRSLAVLRAPASTASSSAPRPDAAVTDDPALAQAYAMVEAAVRRSLPVLLLGETGTGKEMLARHAHRASGRQGAFVAVNCGALPAELIEAELFGYVGGAFSGARREGSIGLIASADGGTLLLDEVRELPLPLQASLLRFLDDRQVRPVGGTATRVVDVQLLAATHADLDAEAAAKRFRADLLYRLNTVCVQLPPLRERSDFATAVRAVLTAVDSAASITDEAIDRLAAHGWPGNFRELRSVLTRALLQGSSRIQATAVAPWLPAPAAAPAAPGSALQQGAADLVRREFQRCGSVSATARALGISRTTVYRHLR